MFLTRKNSPSCRPVTEGFVEFQYKKDETWKFWTQFVFRYYMEFISLYLAMRSEPQNGITRGNGIPGFCLQWTTPSKDNYHNTCLTCLQCQAQVEESPLQTENISEHKCIYTGERPTMKSLQNILDD